VKVQLIRDEFWPYIRQSKYGNISIEVPKELWESYDAARKAFEEEHGKLMDCIEAQGRTARF